MNQHDNTKSQNRAPKWMWIFALISVMAVVGGMWRAIADKASKKEALTESMTSDTAQIFIQSNEWMTLQKKEIPLGVSITGSLSALNRAVIKARVAGELGDLKLREGDSVAEGEIIARVDPTDAEARFRQAKLQADAAQAQVVIQQKLYANNRALVDKGFISQTALATSEANLQVAQANHAAARAAQESARKYLEDTTLRSPIAGQVAQRMAQNGERVGVESPIIEIVNLGELELEAQLPANDSAQIKVGQSAHLELRSSNGQSTQLLKAKVVRINPSALTSNRAVRVYLIVHSSPNFVLRPGMYVEGFIDTDSTNDLAVPLSAVLTDQPLPYVQTVQNNVVQHSTVQLGAQSIGATPPWVIVKGIPAGKIVLAGAVGRLPIGTPVVLQPQLDTTQPR